MKNRLIIFLFVIFLLQELFAQNTLQVNDPQSWWNYSQGNIEEATISIKPQGIYTEYGLYLTFSAKTTYLENLKNLEVVLNFDLPKEASVTDLWLWVGNDIMKALIMDKWKASSIYENIVARRKDPALLQKKSSTHYELRIYPMNGNETRRIKLTYLVPTQWNAESISCELPVSIFKTSRKQLNKLDIIYWQTDNLKNPRIIEYPAVKFVEKNDVNLGTYHTATLTSGLTSSTLNFETDTPMKNGIYISKFEDKNNANEKYYQVALIPSKLINFVPRKKILFLFDYDAIKSTNAAKEVIDIVKNSIKQYLAPTDSFSVMFSSLNIIKGSSKWLAADSTNIRLAFTNSTSVSSYSMMSQLLAEGINFIKTNGNQGSILLVTNSDQAGDFRIANPLINDLMKTMTNVFPIHVADYNNQNYNYFYFGGKNYRGNEYFYDNITRKTNGFYSSISKYGTIQEVLKNNFSAFSGFIGSFDLITNLVNGFCYSRYNLNEEQNAVYLNRPITQTGKYYGDFPFELKASGVYDNLPFTSQRLINNEEIVIADESTRKIWAGRYIQNLERREQNNNVINEIIDFSVKNRILSTYTAFLALEPSDTVKPCFDCFDDSKLATDINDEETEIDSTISLKAFPNPFNSQIKIEVKIGKNVKITDDWSVKIYNMLGQVVKTYTMSDIEESKLKGFSWNGKSDSGENVASGMYVFSLNTPNRRITSKLLLIK